MSCPQCIGIESQFGDKVARRELRRFLKSGGKRQTKILLEQLREIGIRGRTLLDIGGGIGAIQHAFADDGASDITSVDASSAYLATAREEATTRGYAPRASYLQGNFVDLAPQIDLADFVTMDRVICCYPDLVDLLRPAADRARIALALVFPRDNAFMRAGAKLANLALRIGRSDFRAFVHPHKAVEDCVAEAGLSPAYSQNAGVWRVAVFVRKQRD